ncbi:hypothetical protein B0H14DRAFT_2622350 [Mycena olivaceomarginata]|nr:hypothetical protein B0H14DRAFT_2622350 [Mycena olivaceomarginata]
MVNAFLRAWELARIRRMSIRDQIAAHLKKSRYKERHGLLYVKLRVFTATGAVEVKAGWTGDVTRRQLDYLRCQSDAQEMVWLVAYECRHPKRVERLVHLYLEQRGARLRPRTCSGTRCQTRHREYFHYVKAGGIDGVLEIVEGVLVVLGEDVIKIVLE